MNPTIEIQTVQKQLPIFATNISQFKDELRLASEAILEEKEKNPVPMESNVKAQYVSDYNSHLVNPKFQPLINLVLSLSEEVSKKYFNVDLKFKCFNCWGMIYNEGDFTKNHSHFPSTFAAVIYIDLEENSSPLLIEDELSVVPTKGSLILFPALLKHEVPKTQGKRMVVAMNIDHIS